MIIQEAKASLLAANKWLDGYNIQQIVSQSDVENWNGSDVHHGVKVANLTDSWKT